MTRDASIEITKKCLNRCLHCSSRSTYSSREELPFELIVAALNDLKKAGFDRVCLSGGEPMLYADMLDVIEYAGSLNLSISVYTSGVVGTIDDPASVPEDVFRMAKSAGLSSVMFNLQSSIQEEYDLITNTKGHFCFAIESIKNAISSGLRCEIHYVPMAYNWEGIGSILAFAKKMGVDQVSFLELVPHGRAKDNICRLKLSEEQLMIVRRTLSDFEKSGESLRIGLPLQEGEGRSPCHAVADKLYIKYDGCVYGCEAFKYLTHFDGQHKVVHPDNIFTRPLSEIIERSDYLFLSKEMIESYSRVSSSCESCPVQKYLREIDANDLQN